MRSIRAALPLAASLSGGCLASCSRSHSALSPAGPDAQQITNLIWIFIAVCTAIWLLVMIALAIAILRRRSARPDPLQTDVPRERRIASVIGVCIGGTAVVVIALTLLSYFSQRRLFADESVALTVRVIGHQWWWDVQYENPQPARSFIDANEIHIPVGAPVRLVLKTADVIHSFWIPSLAGKMDQITGQDNELRLSASKPGIYRGQCAEFCGEQHAHMAFFVIASTQSDFESWRATQLQSAATPRDPLRQRGLQVFFTGGCMLCHTLRGTQAGGKLGPDLTHVGSRQAIAAGTLPNTPGSLAAWIADPQHVKPGAQMPSMSLSGEELTSLVAYLTGLK